MKWFAIPRLDQRESADLLVLPCWEGGAEAADFGFLKKQAGALLKTGDFKGKQGETIFFYPEEDGKEIQEPRVLFLGLGKQEKVNPEILRRSFAAAVRAAKSRNAQRVNFVFPHVKKLKREELLRGVFEGICLTNYAFVRLKGDASLKQNPVVLIERAGFIGLHKSDVKQLQRLESICLGTIAVRDLVNGNADDVTPEQLAKKALESVKSSSKLKIKILDKKLIEKEKMGLLLAVSRGSSVEPRFIELRYRGNPDSQEHIVLVGKGVTYDTGGLSLKPTEGMLTMKCDMAGAATVLEVVHIAAKLKLKVNVTALAPATENCIDGKSYKPGDVYRSHNGKTVEINNTDAEGRLILADALSYAVKHLEPTCMVDVATLTGGMVIALGEEMSGLFTKDDRLAKDLLEASSETGELIWRMPLNEDYKETLKSEIADLINTSGRDASSMKAAFFLQEFTDDVSWAHIDLAGPAFLSKPKHYNTTQATGYGLRLLIAFLERRSS